MKEPIISDIVSHSEFRFATLCGKTKEKAQVFTSKKKDVEILSYKAQMIWKRERAFEFTIEWSEDMTKIDKKHRYLDDGKGDIRVHVTYYLEPAECIDEDDDSSSDEDEMALTQAKTAS